MHINLLEECRRRENTHPDLHPRTPVPSLHHSCISTGIIVQNRPYDNQKRNKQNANPDHCNQHATANEKQTNQPPIPPLKANNSLSHDSITKDPTFNNCYKGSLVLLRNPSGVQDTLSVNVALNVARSSWMQQFCPFDWLFSESGFEVQPTVVHGVPCTECWEVINQLDEAHTDREGSVYYALSD